MDIKGDYSSISSSEKNKHYVNEGREKKNIPSESSIQASERRKKEIEKGIQEQDRLRREKEEEIVKKLLHTHEQEEESEIVWKDLKFYKQKEVDKTYIHVINRETGEILKKVPEQEFIEATKNLSVRYGVLVDIHG